MTLKFLEDVHILFIFRKMLVLFVHGPLAKYVKLRVAHAPGMPGTFSPLPRFSDPDMHHGTCVTHVPWCMPGSLISGFLWSWWRGIHSRHSQRMRNPQFYVSGKSPMPCDIWPGVFTMHIAHHFVFDYMIVIFAAMIYFDINTRCILHILFITVSNRIDPVIYTVLITIRHQHFIY